MMYLVYADGVPHFVEKASSGFMAIQACAHLFPEGTKMRSEEVKRFITIYNEYFDASGENRPRDAETPIVITERKNGVTTTYCKPFGINDKTTLYNEGVKDVTTFYTLNI